MGKPRTIKVRVDLTVEVDCDGWADIYGVSRNQIRDDVRAYCEIQVRESAAANEDLIRVIRPPLGSRLAR
jgi:hypothetical protein